MFDIVGKILDYKIYAQINFRTFKGIMILTHFKLTIHNNTYKDDNNKK